MTSWPLIRKLSVLLGYHGICPEALEKIRDNPDLFSREIYHEYDDFTTRLQQLLAPVPAHDEDDGA